MLKINESVWQSEFKPSAGVEKGVAAASDKSLIYNRERESTMATETLSPPALLEAPLPKDILSKLYEAMWKARLLAKKWRNSVPMSEAVLAGATANLAAEDLVMSAGVHPILAVLRGEPAGSLGTAKSRRTRNDSSDAQGKVIVADGDSASAIAAGLALALKRAQSSAVIVLFINRKLTRGPAWQQATQFAASYRLPIVFVADATAGRSPRKHEGHDLSHWPCPTIAVDGRDVIAVYRVTKEAISAARRGHGPTLVDCVRCPAAGNRGCDEPDPLASYRGYLKRHNAWSHDGYEDLQNRLQAEMKTS